MVNVMAGYLKTKALLDFTITKIRSINTIFQKYSLVSEWLTLTKLLFSIIEMEKRHEAVLFTLSLNWPKESETEVPDNSEKGPQDFFSSVEFQNHMSYPDFLSMLIHYFNERNKVYLYLASRSHQREIINQLKILADEVKKQKHWVLDRFELEILTIL